MKERQNNDVGIQARVALDAVKGERTVARWPPNMACTQT